MTKVIIMVGSARVMDHTMIPQVELEKVQRQLIWKFQNMSLLMLTLLKSDRDNE